MKKKQKQFLIKSFLLALVSLALTLLISFVSDRLESEPIKRIEDSIYDLAFRGRSKNNQFKTVRPEDILIIDVDDESIKAVSYTHLDVYKRQQQGLLVAESFTT